MNYPSELMDVKWSGLDLVPLPCESIYSTLIRFSDLNCMRFKDMRRQLILTSGDILMRSNRPEVHLSFLAKSSIAITKFQCITGWKIQYDHEYTLENSYWSERVSRLRICPICSESGYHSFWFQFAPLKVCPIHDCLLVDHCQSCSKELPEYAFSKLLFDTPGQCIQCMKPYCGADLHLEMYLDFRKQAGSIEQAFQPFIDWLRSYKKSRISFELLHQSRAKTQALRQWCRPEELFLGIADKLHPLPRLCTQSTYKHITVLTWRLRPADQMRFGVDRRVEQRHTLDVASAAYRSTLHMLQEWIKTLDRRPEWTEDIAPPFVQDGFVDPSKGDPRELAYMLLRYQMESDERWGLYTNVRNAQLNLVFKSREEIHFAKRARLAWRAFFLAAYASLLHTIFNAQSKRLLNLREIRLPADEMVIQYLQYTLKTFGGIGELEGGVAFPTIPGMPLRPFQKKDKWADSTTQLPTQH